MKVVLIIALIVAALWVYNWLTTAGKLPDGRTVTNVVGPVPS